MPDDVKALLGRALDGEPPLDIDRDAIFADGRARLRRRRSIASAGVAFAVVAAALGTTALAGGLLGQPSDIGPAASGSAPVVPRPPVSTTKSPPRSVGGVPTVSWPSLSDALKYHQIPWPAEVVAVRGKPGGPPDFRFEGNTLAVILSSQSGDRSLVLTVEQPTTLRMFCRVGEDCVRDERPDGVVIRRKTEHKDGTETVLVNIKRPNGAEISVVESPWGDHARPLRLLPDATFVTIGTAPGLSW